MNLLAKKDNNNPNSITESELIIHMGCYKADNYSLLMGWEMAQIGQ
jgi:hypothetical protein